MNFPSSDKKHADETISMEEIPETLTQEMLQKHHASVADKPSDLAIAKAQEIMASKDEDDEEEFPPLLDSPTSAEITDENALGCSTLQELPNDLPTPADIVSPQSERYTLYVCGEVGTHGADNSGLNILFAEDEEVCANTGELLKLSARVRMFDIVENRFVGCMMVPRSSIRKSSLILQNSVGIIDPGYQGTLHAPVFNVSNFDSCFVKKGESLVQVVHPTLALFNVVSVSEDHPAFADKTERGDKGFGSTGLA
jgi:dUTPase